MAEKDARKCLRKEDFILFRKKKLLARNIRAEEESSSITGSI
jgi:hypothetical protein